jgi:hypothetical protein
MGDRETGLDMRLGLKGMNQSHHYDQSRVQIQELIPITAWDETQAILGE